MQVGPAVARYLAHQRQAGRLGEVTISHRRRTLRTFEQSVGKTPIDRLDRRHVERWLAKRGRKPGTKRQYLTCVRSFARWLVKQGYMTRDFTLGVDPPRIPRRDPRALTPEQVGRILAASDARERLCVLLMAQEGLRVGEVTRLEVGDLDIARRAMRVKGKGGHERQLPISDETWEAMTGYLGAGYWSAGALVTSQLDEGAGLVPHTMTLLISDLMKRAEVPGSAHALRHTCASDVLEECGDIVAVADMLGHQSINVTRLYLRNTKASRLRSVMSGRRYG